MKRSIFCLIVVLFSLMLNNVRASDSLSYNIATTDKSVINQQLHAAILISRLNEIKEMDKSHMSGAEKKLLRKEVKAINKDLVRSNGGIYLSVGAILLIILLLIILL